MRPDDRDAGYLLDMLQHAQGVVRAIRGRRSRMGHGVEAACRRFALGTKRGSRGLPRNVG